MATGRGVWLHAIAPRMTHGQIPPLAIGDIFKTRTGRWKLPRKFSLYGTFQRPVRRFLPATWVSLQGSSRRCSSGIPKHGRTKLPPTLTAPSPNARRDDGLVRPATPSSSTPLCAAQARPARSFGLQETRVRSETPRLSPCRRRETIFRGPRGWRLTSFPHHQRRPHLAGTPAGVSESGTGGLWARVEAR